MLKKFGLAVALISGVSLVGACSDSQQANTATGALVGAAAGQAFGEGSGRVAATLIGAAIGAQVGANQPASGTCVYRNNETGETFRAACP
jgi:uncharacterized protein YcfJ